MPCGVWWGRKVSNAGGGRQASLRRETCGLLSMGHIPMPGCSRGKNCSLPFRSHVVIQRSRETLNAIFPTYLMKEGNGILKKLQENLSHDGRVCNVGPARPSVFLTHYRCMIVFLVYWSIERYSAYRSSIKSNNSGTLPHLPAAFEGYSNPGKERVQRRMHRTLMSRAIGARLLPH